MSGPEAAVVLSPTCRLELRPGADAVVLEDAHGVKRTLLAHSLLERTGPIVHAYMEAADTILVGRARGLRLFHIDAELRCREIHLDLERLPHSEQMSLHATSALFITMTENGILGLDSTGGERWRIQQTTAGWGFVGEADAALYFSDANGNLVAIDARTGAEVDG